MDLPAVRTARTILSILLRINFLGQAQRDRLLPTSLSPNSNSSSKVPDFPVAMLRCVLSMVSLHLRTPIAMGTMTCLDCLATRKAETDMDFRNPNSTSTMLNWPSLENNAIWTT